MGNQEKIKNDKNSTFLSDNSETEKTIDYSKKMLYKRSNHTLLKILLIPAGIVLFLVLAINIYMSANNVDLIIKYSEMYDLDPALVCSVIYTESKFNDNATSNKGAIGYMQLMPETAEYIRSEMKKNNFDLNTLETLVDSDHLDLTDTEINVFLGTWYLRYLLDLFSQNEINAICAYNAGPSKVTEWLNDFDIAPNGKDLLKIPYKETRQYVQKVNIMRAVFSGFLRLRIG